MEIQCEKCKQSNMVQDRIHRMSGCLVMIGYFLVIPGLLAMFFGLFIMYSGASTNLSDDDGQSKRTLGMLTDAKVPANIISEYRETGKIAQDSISKLQPRDKSAVDNALHTERASKIGHGIGVGIIAATGGAMTVAAFMVGLPAFIVGFLLLLKRSVWRCPSCGYIFDRA
ncbi:MAG: hypothetical protein WA705_14060 [Candidatus Ozemobacteraceae bacterium]